MSVPTILSPVQSPRQSGFGNHDEDSEPCLGANGSEWVEDEIAQGARLSVFVTIHRIRRLILASIDDPYTVEQLKAPRMNMLVVRPLVDRLYNPDDLFIVYCLLANRVHFLRSHSSLTLHRTVNLSRASLCELVASRVLRRFHEDHPGDAGLVLLANILVSGWDPFQGAPEAVAREGRLQQWPIQQRGGHERKLTALELAILSESKMFIASSACQRVVDAVHQGLIVYSPLSFVDILPDHYKHHPVTLYNPRRAPLLNHYRLIVPRSRNLIETVQFAVLLALFVMFMTKRNSQHSGAYEAVFVLYTAGWILEQFAAIIEHGWEVHAQSLWTFLDMTFIAIYTAYLVARLVQMAGDIIQPGRGVALHILCLAAPVLLTRIAFSLMPDNIVFISLHALMKDFTRMTFIAIWCFTGFLLALLWLIDVDGPIGTSATQRWATVGKWLLWIWFGLDGTPLDLATEIDVVLGPALMIAFAFLGNTLFLTILVAMLTNTFSHIIGHEAAEIRFRRAVLAFQGVKSDSIFLYPPPFNILALLIMLPLKLLLSSRTFHTVNVAVVRVLNAPTLLIINLYERQYLVPATPRRKSPLNWRFTGFSPHGDVLAVLETEPPLEVQELLEEMESLSDVGCRIEPELVGSWGSRDASRSHSPGRRHRRRSQAPSVDVFRLSNAPHPSPG